VHARTHFLVRWAAIHSAALQGRGCGAPTSAIPALVAAGANVKHVHIVSGDPILVASERLVTFLLSPDATKRPIRELYAYYEHM
jgi:hypothetical protein